MNLLWDYIDLIVLVLCFVSTGIHSVRMVRKATVPVRRIPAFFLVFGAASIACFMGFGHLFEISFHAGEKMAAGTFEYNFRFYSLILMGLVLLSLSVRMLNDIRDWLQGKETTPKAIVKTVLLIVVLSAPTGTFTPIGYVPTVACVISMVFLPFTVKKRQRSASENVFIGAAGR